MTVRGDPAPRRPTSRRSPVLPRAFYDRDTAVVARELLGAVLECRSAEGVTAGRIVETEAYMGEDDPACHAAAGLTARTSPLYDHPGTAYVYFIYGRYWCVNAVTRARGLPSAVLVRAVEPIAGIDLMWKRRPRARNEHELTNGPSKLCLAMAIDGRHNGLSLLEPPLVVREGDAVADRDVVVTPRIGITKAAEVPLRWLVRGNPYVSKTPKHFLQRTI